MALSSSTTKRRRAGPQRESEVGGLDRFEVDLDHGVAGDSTALGGSFADPRCPLLQRLDVPLQPVNKRLIEQGAERTIAATIS